MRSASIMKSLSMHFYAWSSWRTLLLISLIYGLFLTRVMAPHAIEMQRFAGDWGAPDGHLFYTPQELYSHIDTWDAAGRTHYIRFRLGLDPLWAVTYTAFLVAFTSIALRGGTSATDRRRTLNLVPLVPFVADLLENILGIALVNALPAQSSAVAADMGAVSFTKWVTLALAHIILLYALLLMLRARLKRR